MAPSAFQDAFFIMPKSTQTCVSKAYGHVFQKHMDTYGHIFIKMDLQNPTPKTFKVTLNAKIPMPAILLIWYRNGFKMFNSDNSYSKNEKDTFVEKPQLKIISLQNESDIANCHPCMESNLK